MSDRSVVSLLLCKVTYSQALGTRAWTSLGHHVLSVTSSERQMPRWASKGWEPREEAGRASRWWCRSVAGAGELGGGRVGQEESQVATQF